jgi:methionyl-tRNA synthetase
MEEKRNIFTDSYRKSMESYNLKDALDVAFAYGTELNQYIDTMKPWKMDAETDRDAFEETLSTIGCGLYTIAQALLPFFETKMQEMLERIGTPSTGVQVFDLPSGFIILEKGEPLYQRVEIEK